MDTHHPIWEALRSGSAGILGGGAAFRYAQIIVRDMPKPLDTDGRLYHWAWKSLQDLMNTGVTNGNGNGGAH